ncbi:ATP-binding cassette domain-containing protein [Bacillus aerolatus]|uniref:ATP-binding cassette domain-containing protein n=1 Tax=Bacillus aerolatus TaxID=2653354 RepID=A0A6I1FPA8_9BACI|nr:ABC transporter ATP-binding protein [Bacillus aerolatus]KAB7708246.1 ATP-binding cassette domain-containing protein [Bacillus aerolatus]
MNVGAYIKPYRFTFVLVFLMGVISTIITAAQPLMGKFLIDEVLIEKRYSFPVVLSICVLIMMIGFGVALLTKFLYLRMSLRLMVDMRSAFYNHLLHLPFSFFTKNRTGDILSRINEDLTEIQRLYTENVLQLFTISLTFLLNILLLFMLDWRLTFLSFLFMPLLIFGIHKFRHLIFTNQMELRRQSAKNQSFMYETFSSVGFIRTSHLESTLQETFKKELKEINRQNIKVIFIQAWAQGIPQMLIMISAILMLWFLGSRVINGTMTIGTMLAFITYQASLYGTVQGLAQLYIRLQKGKASIYRVNDFFNIPQEEDGESLTPPSFQAIHFRDVSFAFENSRPIVDGFNISIRKGEKLGLVGENGIGKSTIAQLLARIYQPASGAIYMDDKDVQSFSKKSWYETVCLVAHNHPVWFGTVREFLQLGKKGLSEIEMLNVLEIVGLNNWLQSLPQRLQTVIGEKGITLSAGQKQRLLLARALLNDADIFILDEATCHLDVESEYHLFRTLKEYFAQKTVIVITHRYDNLDWMDRVINLSGGEEQYSQKKAGGMTNDNVSILHG